MKKFLLIVVISSLLAFPKVNFGQTSPNLGTTSGFALFTAVGAFNNTGASAVTGDVGTNAGAFNAFPPGTLIGTKHVLDPISTTAATDVAIAYSDLTQVGTVIGVGLGNGQILLPGVYQTGAASTLNGNLTLDGQGNPDALFIIRIGGAFATGASSNVILTNSASLCNVYWQINGKFDLGDASVFRGTLVADGAITLLEGSSLLGRGLSKAGAISLNNNTVTNPQVAAAGTITGNATICQGEAGLIYSVTAISNATGYSWNLPSGATITQGTNTNSITVDYSTIASSGNITVQGNNSCGTGTLSANFAVTVNPFPTAPTVGTITQPTCTLATGSIVLNGLPATGTWTLTRSPGGTTTTGTGTSSTVSLLAAGTYTFTVTNASGCISLASANVVINTQPEAPTAPTVGTITQPTCALETGSVVLSGLPAGNWTINPGTVTGSTTSTTISGLAAGTYNFTVTNAALCTSLASVNVIISAASGAPIVGTITQPTCELSTGRVVLSGLPAGNWTINPGAITGSTTSTIIAGLVAGTYHFTFTNAAGCTSIDYANVVITAAPVVPSAPIVETITQPTCALTTGSVVLSGLPAGNWTINPGAVSGSTASTILAGLVAGSHHFTVTNAAGCTSLASANVVINAVPEAPAAPIVGTITQPTCALTTGTVVLSGLPAGNWTINPGAVTGSTTSTTISGLVAGTYHFTVTNAAVCTSIPSANVVITAVPEAPAAPIVGTITHPTCVLVTGSVVLSGLPAGNWTINPGSVTGSTTSTTISGLVAGTYHFTVTNAAVCASLASANVVIAVAPEVPAAIAGADRTICLNSNTQIGASAVNGNTYKWSSVPAGFTSTLANPTVKPLLTTIYTVVETNSASNCQNTNSVTVSLYTAPDIKTQPADQTVCIDESVSFGVTASGADLTYQWRKGTLALTNGGNISGATSAMLTINHVNVSDAASNYNVLIAGACSAFETSKNVTLTVNKVPSISTSVCVGSSVNFSASSTGAGVTYQWRKGDINLADGGNISGTTSATLSINPVNISDASPNYNVIINGLCSPGGTPLNIGLLVNSTLNIVSEPTNQVVCVDNSATFSVGTTGSALTYQWRKGTISLINGGNISGATSATLTINPVNAADVASDYNVVVTGPCSPIATSKNVSLSLCIPTPNNSIGAGDAENTVTIYPNPFTSSIDIKVNDVSKIKGYELKIYNILGEVVINIPITKDITTLKTGNLSPGIYLYEVNSNNKTIQTGKLISGK